MTCTLTLIARNEADHLPSVSRLRRISFSPKSSSSTPARPTGREYNSVQFLASRASRCFRRREIFRCEHQRGRDRLCRGNRKQWAPAEFLCGWHTKFQPWREPHLLLLVVPSSRDMDRPCRAFLELKSVISFSELPPTGCLHRGRPRRGSSQEAQALVSSAQGPSRA
jgi:hypothetical protein